MRIFGQAVLILAVFFLTAAPAYAQITLNLDVLTEDFVPKDAITSAPDPVPAPSEKTKAPERPRATPEKPKVAERPQAKKKAPPKVQKKQKPKAASSVRNKKAAAKSKASKAKKTETSKKKAGYQVKESRVQDEHDRLKPRAKPVPTVKVVPIKEKVKIRLAEREENEKTAQEPQLSKHFLEQQQALKEAEAAEKAREKIVLKPPKNPVPAPKTLLAKDKRKKKQPSVRDKAEQLAAKEEKEQRETKILPFASIVHTPEDLTGKERSDALAQKVPQESETALAVRKKKELAAVLLFEKTSSDLTPEMETELDSLIAVMRKSPDKRMTVFAYSAPTEAPDFGRERQVSLRRALSVRSYMSRAGISSLRVDIRALGQRGAGTVIPNRADVLLYER